MTAANSLHAEVIAAPMHVALKVDLTEEDDRIGGHVNQQEFRVQSAITCANGTRKRHLTNSSPATRVAKASYRGFPLCGHAGKRTCLDGLTSRHLPLPNNREEPNTHGN
jgi:hypothetical protein